MWQGRAGLHVFTAGLVKKKVLVIQLPCSLSLECVQ